MGAIYKKELRSYFTTVMGFIYAALFLVIIGIYYVVYNFVNMSPNFEYVVSNVEFLYIVLIPILTMRLMAEENKQKTDQLLLTSPISIGKIVVGKYLAVLSMFLIPIVIICFYPLILTAFGEVQLKVAYSGIFGFAMLGAAYLALGLFISNLTENQVIALIITAVAILLSYLMPGIATLIPSDNQTAWLVLGGLFLVICFILYLAMHNMTLTLALGIVGEAILAILYFVKPSIYDGSITKLFDGLSISEKYSNFVYGILDMNAIIYYLSIIVLFLLLTVQCMKKRRWS